MIDRLAELEARYEDVSRQMSTPEVASDPGALANLGRELSRLEPIVTTLREWRAVREELDRTRTMVDDPDEEVRTMAREEIARLSSREEKLDQTLRVQARAARSERRPRRDPRGARRHRRRRGRSLRRRPVPDVRPLRRAAAMEGRGPLDLGERLGRASRRSSPRCAATAPISRLKFESGVHRVQRVPSTEAAGRIHTSTATVSILPEADEVEIQIPDKDLRIDVYRSSGPGGQSVNTTDSAVRITHLPTGLMVAIQDEKSQHKNKAKALAVLRARLLEMEQARLAAERGDQRRSQVGSGERSEKIRTYNFPDDRVTDHRIGITVHNLPGLLEGDLDRVIEPLVEAEQTRRLGSLRPG